MKIKEKRERESLRPPCHCHYHVPLVLLLSCALLFGLWAVVTMVPNSRKCEEVFRQ